MPPPSSHPPQPLQHAQPGPGKEQLLAQLGNLSVQAAVNPDTERAQTVAAAAQLAAALSPLQPADAAKLLAECVLVLLVDPSIGSRLEEMSASVVPFARLAAHLPPALSGPYKKELSTLVLTQLNVKRPTNAPRHSVFALAETFARLVELGELKIDGAVLTIVRLLGSREKRMAAVTMARAAAASACRTSDASSPTPPLSHASRFSSQLGKTVEVCFQQLTEACAPATMAQLRNALNNRELAESTEFGYDVTYTASCLGWEMDRPGAPAAPPPQQQPPPPQPHYSTQPTPSPYSQPPPPPPQQHQQAGYGMAPPPPMQQQQQQQFAAPPPQPQASYQSQYSRPPPPPQYTPPPPMQQPQPPPQHMQQQVQAPPPAAPPPAFAPPRPLTSLAAVTSRECPPGSCFALAGDPSRRDLIAAVTRPGAAHDCMRVWNAGGDYMGDIDVGGGCIVTSLDVTSPGVLLAATGPKSAGSAPCGVRCFAGQGGGAGWTQVGVLDRPEASALVALAWLSSTPSANSLVFALGETQRGELGKREAVVVFDLQSSPGKFELLQPLCSLYGHSELIMCLAGHPSHDQLLISASKDRTIRLWDRREAKHGYAGVAVGAASSPGGPVTAHTDMVSTLSVGGNHLLSGGVDGWVKLWDLRFIGNGPNGGTAPAAAWQVDGASPVLKVALCAASGAAAVATPSGLFLLDVRGGPGGRPPARATVPPGRTEGGGLYHGLAWDETQNTLFAAHNSGDQQSPRLVVDVFQAS